MSMQVQNQIRQNASDLRNYLEDLYSWEDQANKGTAAPNKQEQPTQKEYKIRGKTNAEEKAKKKKAKPSKRKEMIRDGTSIPAYYEAWDQFNPDEYDDSSDEEEHTADKIAFDDKRKNHPITQQTSGAEQNTKIIVKGGANDYNPIEALKEKGNFHFKNSDFDKAIDVYTECLEKAAGGSKVGAEVVVTLFSNRAMAYLKVSEFGKAIDDCNNAIDLDSSHIKSYVRRAKANIRLDNQREALRDYKEALALEENNTEVKTEVARLQKKIDTIKYGAKNKMIVNFMNIPDKERRRVVVDDIVPETSDKENNDDDINQSKDKQKSKKPSKKVGFVSEESKDDKMVNEGEKKKENRRVQFTGEDNTDKTDASTPKTENPTSVLKNKIKIEEVSAKIDQQKSLDLQKQLFESGEQGVSEEISIKNSSEFYTTWNYIKMNVFACEKLLTTKAKLSTFPKLFPQGLETAFFFELIDFANQIFSSNPQISAEVLIILPQLKRFAITKLSLEPHQKKVLKSLIEKIKSSGDLDDDTKKKVSANFK